MDSDPSSNPYSAPASELGPGPAPDAQGPALAGRRTRLTAVSIDGLIISVPLLPALVMGMYQVMRLAAQVDVLLAEDPWSALSQLEAQIPVRSLGLVAGAGLLVALAIAVYQWVLISRTGQTLGKKATGIRIEKLDGSRVGFASGVVLRNWVPKLTAVDPRLGLLLQLVDCLFIYRQDQRCLHDRLAGTRVVRCRR